MLVALLNRNNGVEYTPVCMLRNNKGREQERTKTKTKAKKTTRDTRSCGGGGIFKHYAALHRRMKVMCYAVLCSLLYDTYMYIYL